MHRIDGEDHVGNKFAAGDPELGVPGTQVTPEWLNAVQEEIAKLVETLGLTLDKEDDEQLVAALTPRLGPAVLSWGCGQMPTGSSGSLWFMHPWFSREDPPFAVPIEHCAILVPGPYGAQFKLKNLVVHTQPDNSSRVGEPKFVVVTSGGVTNIQATIGVNDYATDFTHEAVVTAGEFVALAIQNDEAVFNPPIAATASIQLIAI